MVVQKISQNDASLKFSISSEIISSARAREHTHKHKKRDRFASPQKRTRRYLLNGFRERLGTLCVRIIVAFNTVLKLESLFPRQHERVCLVVSTVFETAFRILTRAKYAHTRRGSDRNDRRISRALYSFVFISSDRPRFSSSA